MRMSLHGFVMIAGAIVVSGLHAGCTASAHDDAPLGEATTSNATSTDRVAPQGGAPAAAGSSTTDERRPTTDAGQHENDAGVIDDAQQDAGVVADAGTETASMASLHGTITRTAEPKNGGVGSIYIAVLTADPVTGGHPEVVAAVTLENADMQADGAAVTYTIAGIPPRAEPYVVSAFLDDNHNVDPSSAATAGPDKGDLITLHNFRSPKVTVDHAGDVELDLELNFAMPF